MKRERSTIGFEKEEVQLSVFTSHMIWSIENPKYFTKNLSETISIIFKQFQDARSTYKNVLYFSCTTNEQYKNEMKKTILFLQQK